MTSPTPSLRRYFNVVFAFRFICLAVSLFSATAIYAQNPIRIENSRPGTTDWQLTNPARTYTRFNANDDRDIEGYASLTSVNVGGSLDLFVNTSSAQYRIEFFRFGWYGGAGGRRMAVSQSTDPDSAERSKSNHSRAGRERHGGM